MRPYCIVGHEHRRAAQVPRLLAARGGTEQVRDARFDHFRDLGFVTEREQHRGIYDPLLPVTTWAAVGWAPTGQVLSVSGGYSMIG